MKVLIIVNNEDQRNRLEDILITQGASSNFEVKIQGQALGGKVFSHIINTVSSLRPGHRYLANMGLHRTDSWLELVE